MGVDEFYKTLAYACLYKAYGETADEREAVSITVSMIREAKPEALFSYLRKNSIEVSNPYHGVYYILDSIAGSILFPVQIIVTRELDRENHTWLKALSGKMEKQDMKELLAAVSHIIEKYDRALADSVLDVSISANSKVVEELRGEDTMFEALMEIMEPEINKITREKEIATAIEALREGNLSEDYIKNYIMKKFQLFDAEAEEYLAQ